MDNFGKVISPGVGISTSELTVKGQLDGILNGIDILLLMYVPATIKFKRFN